MDQMRVVANDLPTISDSAHSHTIYDAGTFGQAATGQTPFVGAMHRLGGNAFGLNLDNVDAWTVDNRIKQHQQLPSRNNPQQVALQAIQEALVAGTSFRYVQVFIADPNENIPLDQRVLYKGEPQITDLTDQELFYELDIKGILDKHNSARTGIVNKSVKDRTEYLEAAKVRDLKMVVTTIASF